MTMMGWILVAYVGTQCVQWVADYLNVRSITDTVPDAFQGVYDDEKYKTSQRYLRDKTRFSFLQSLVSLAIILTFVLSGGISDLDDWARQFGYSDAWTGVLFFAVIALALQIIGLPFSLYHTFIIEKRYGFNTTTASLFVKDFIKALVLVALLGGPLLYGVLLFFSTMGSTAWLWVWGFVVVFQLFVMLIAPVWIMPLFNRFVPLEDGVLKEKINAYANKEHFTLQGIYRMDGSKRSTKSNAFFTGFGKFKRIVLFDTLIEKHTIDELLVILAHEMGHYKKKHIHKMVVTSILIMGVTLYVLSLALYADFLFQAFHISTPSVHIGLILFSLLYSPVSLLTGALSSYFSRKHEYEADAYAAETTGHASAMISALKKLSADNLSHLTPHWFKVMLEYSHPTALQRIDALDQYPS